MFGRIDVACAKKNQSKHCSKCRTDVLRCARKSVFNCPHVSVSLRYEHTVAKRRHFG